MMASLLEAEGFVNVISAGGSGGDMGLDISAEEIRTSRSGRVSTFRWMVQAKHYAGTAQKKGKSRPRNVGHKEIADIITFLSEHKAQGLLIVTDTDLTASATKKIASFHEDGRHRFEAHFWNCRILTDRLRKHPDLVDRYFDTGRKSPGRNRRTQNPFKFLEPFKRVDRHLFYGRDHQNEELVGLVCNASVAVLFAESGTGKTSLLNAALIPALLDQHFLAAYSRCLDEPCTNIRREVIRSLENLAKPGEIADLGATANMAEFIRRLRMLLGKFKARMLIAVDQFEEAFTRAGVSEREGLSEAIQVASQPDISPGSLTLLFAIREDYLGSLWEWSHKRRLVEVWENAYRIGRLSTDSAELAISKPLEFVGKKLQKGLAAQVLSDLERIGDGNIFPPYVQIVCGCLFDEAGTATEIEKNLYKSMGKAEGIIGEYLDSRMFVGLSTEYADMAKLVLDSLTGGEGLRTLLSLEEIQQITGIDDSGQLKEIVDFLVKRRVVVPQMEDEEVQGYELVHDFLSRRFFEKLNPAQKRDRAIRDVFRRSFRDWKNHGILVSQNTLDEFFQHREILPLGPEQYCMIIESGFACRKYGDWRDFAKEKGHLAYAYHHVLTESRHGSAVRVALRYARKRDLPTVVGYLSDKRPRVRYKAIQAVERIGDRRVAESLIKFVKDENWGIQRRAIRILAEWGCQSAVPAITVCLKHERTWIRREAEDALKKLRRKAEAKRASDR
jgi:hypothetical protein